MYQISPFCLHFSLNKSVQPKFIWQTTTSIHHQIAFQITTHTIIMSPKSHCHHHSQSVSPQWHLAASQQYTRSHTASNDKSNTPARTSDSDWRSGMRLHCPNNSPCPLYSHSRCTASTRSWGMCGQGWGGVRGRRGRSALCRGNRASRQRGLLPLPGRCRFLRLRRRHFSASRV